jgi:hypothetical protein
MVDNLAVEVLRTAAAGHTSVLAAVVRREMRVVSVHVEAVRADRVSLFEGREAAQIQVFVGPVVGKVRMLKDMEKGLKVGRVCSGGLEAVVLRIAADTDTTCF